MSASSASGGVPSPTSLHVVDKPCWWASCLRCREGDNIEYGGSFHYESEAELRQSLRDQDWVVLDDGRAMCPDCFEETRSLIACPHGAGCEGGGCGCCPSDLAVFARLDQGSRS